jgi:hypothetical protein
MNLPMRLVLVDYMMRRRVRVTKGNNVVGIRLHAIISVVVETIAVIAGAVLAIAVTPAAVRASLGMFAIAIFGGTAFLALWGARLVIRKWPAHCPNCGGRAFRHGIRKVHYGCADCGFCSPTQSGSNI